MPILKNLIDVLANSSLWTAFFGATIGGLFTLLGIRLQQAEQKRIDDEKQNKEIKVFLQSIYSEISSFTEIINEGLREYILDDSSKIPRVFFLIEENFFPIYDNNAKLIGHLESQNLRRSIILTYTKAKATVDALKLYNSIMAQPKEPESDNAVLRHFASSRVASNNKQCYSNLKKNYELYKDELAKLSAILIQDGYIQ